MKFKSEWFVLMIVICILFSITAVAASANQTDATLNQDSILSNPVDDKLEEAADKSYDNFYEDIKNCTDSFDMESDYKYDERDSIGKLEFNQRFEIH